MVLKHPTKNIAIIFIEKYFVVYFLKLFSEKAL